MIFVQSIRTQKKEECNGKLRDHADGEKKDGVCREDMELCIEYDNYVWDTYDRGTKPLFDLTKAYRVKRRIDGAPFHEGNVNKLYQLHG